MNRTETSRIVAAITAAYPGHFRGYTTQQLDNLINTWCMVFDDYSYEQASAGLKVFLTSDTKGFPPSPGQVVDCITKITSLSEKELSPDEAWYLVVKAVRNSSYNAEKEFDKLPETVKKIIINPAKLKEWALVDEEQLQTIDKSLFFRSYRAQIERDKLDAKIPGSIKMLIQSTADKIAAK